jgi:hypothetical protein
MEVLTPIKAIRAKCIDCSCGSLREVRECHMKDCTLWPYRMGKRPKNDKYINENELAEKNIS